MVSEDCFSVLEFDLTKDDLGPMRLPAAVTEAEARARLVTLGLSEAEIDARLSWAKLWTTTRIFRESDHSS